MRAAAFRIRRMARLPIAALAMAACLLLAPPLQAAMPIPASCLAASPINLRVRIGAGPERAALLQGGAAPALVIRDADTAQILWTAAAQLPASRVFASMHAAFSGSLLALDLDADGLHDRIYAGDLAGRLWRFDLHHGEPAEHWATGAVFADFSSATRGFMAAPDASLSGTQLTLVAGTARIADAAVDNRLYVLHDRHAFESWSQQQHDSRRPLRESDLRQLPRLGAPLTEPAPDGYFILIGGYDILSPSLTVSGRATLALADASAQGTDCVVATVVSSINLADAREQGVALTGGTAPDRLVMRARAGERFTLGRDADRLLCRLGDSSIAACHVDVSPRRLWWRREDAD